MHFRQFKTELSTQSSISDHLVWMNVFVKLWPTKKRKISMLKPEARGNEGHSEVHSLGLHVLFPTLQQDISNSPHLLFNAIITTSLHWMNGYSINLWKLNGFEFWLMLSLPLLYGHTRGGRMRPPSWWNASTAQIRRCQNSEKTNPLESSMKQCRIAINYPVDNACWCFHLLRLLHHGPLHTSIAWHETMEKHPTIIINTENT